MSQKTHSDNVGKRSPVKKREAPAQPRLKTISWDKLNIELMHVSSAFERARLDNPLRETFNADVVRMHLAEYFKIGDIPPLIEAERIIRGYMQDQREVGPAVQKFILGWTESMFLTQMRNKNNDAKRLDGLSPGFVVEKLTENSPRNQTKDKEPLPILTGEMKRAYCSLAFIFTAVTFLLERNEDKKILPAAMRKSLGKE